MIKKCIKISKNVVNDINDFRISLITLSKHKVMSYNQFGNSIGTFYEPAFIYGYNYEKVVMQTLTNNKHLDFMEVRNHQFALLEKIPFDEFNISEVLGETFVENPLYLIDELSEAYYSICLSKIKSGKENSPLIIEQLCHQYNAVILKIAKSYEIPFHLLQDSFSRDSLIQKIYSSLKKRIEIDLEHNGKSLMELGSWIVRQEVIKMRKRTSFDQEGL